MAHITFSVVVPTYRRPKDLAHCLQALKQQLHPVDDLQVIVRDTDTDTLSFLERFELENLPLKVTRVNRPGVIAAMNTGLNAAKGDIVAFTDDDAAPHPDWLQRLGVHYRENPKVGAVGGRDFTYINGQLQDASTHPGASDTVGKVQWFGRMVGNHHIGDGPAREVDILKGVNMSFRRDAIKDLWCDERFLGSGAQVRFEVALCLAVKQQGWQLVYDPAVAVDHFPAQRHDEDTRGMNFNYIACRNIAHNETLALMDYLPPFRKIVYLVWAITVGTRGTPGFLQLLRFLPSEKGISIKKWLATVEGRWLGLMTWQKHT